MCENCEREAEARRYQDFQTGDVVMSKVDLKVYFVSCQKDRCRILCHEVNDNFDVTVEDVVEVLIKDLQDMTYSYSQ